MITNRMKQALKAGETVFGTWSMLPSPEVVSVLSSAGLDFVIIDMEHAPMSFETAQNQIYAIGNYPCTPVIRLGENSEASILRALESGAQSILVSHISSAKEAEAVVRAARYYPDGERGLSPFTFHHGYSDVKLPEKLHAANEQTFVGVLVEGEEGIHNLEEIADIPGLDMVYLGIYDMSQVLGIPGELNHPKVLSMLKDCVKMAEAKGIVAGSVARDQDYLALMFELGFRFISYRVDNAVLREGFETPRHWYNELTTRKEQSQS